VIKTDKSLFFFYLKNGAAVNAKQTGEKIPERADYRCQDQ